MNEYIYIPPMVFMKLDDLNISTSLLKQALQFPNVHLYDLPASMFQSTNLQSDIFMT